MTPVRKLWNIWKENNTCLKSKIKLLHILAIRVFLQNMAITIRTTVTKAIIINKLIHKKSPKLLRILVETLKGMEWYGYVISAIDIYATILKSTTLVRLIGGPKMMFNIILRDSDIEKQPGSMKWAHQILNYPAARQTDLVMCLMLMTTMMMSQYDEFFFLNRDFIILQRLMGFYVRVLMSKRIR